MCAGGAARKLKNVFIREKKLFKNKKCIYLVREAPEVSDHTGQVWRKHQRSKLELHWIPTSTHAPAEGDNTEEDAANGTNSCL